MPLPLSLSLPSCSELPTPAEYIYQYPDGPGLYTRASHTGGHRGHPWQICIVLAGPCCSLSCPGAALPGHSPPAPGPGCQAGFLLISWEPGRTEFQSLLYYSNNAVTWGDHPPSLDLHSPVCKMGTGKLQVEEDPKALAAVALGGLSWQLGEFERGKGTMLPCHSHLLPPQVRHRLLFLSREGEEEVPSLCSSTGSLDGLQDGIPE